MLTRLSTILSIALLLVSAAGAQQQRPEGEAKKPKTRALAAGSKLLQDNDPVQQLNVHVNGLHPLKDDPAHQMIADHFCRQVNQDFAQCALFDGSGKDANLTGIEYIISEKLFESLPAGEKQFWHPHNYEILSGQLIAPGLPEAAERALMKEKINSYGKTWHVWMTGTPGHPGDKMPLGPARLAWSLNHDGEAAPGLLEARDSNHKVNTAEKRKSRADMAGLARPQQGVNALRKAFPNAGPAPAGVKDKEEQ